jgi:hypothetical protein
MCDILSWFVCLNIEFAFCACYISLSLLLISLILCFCCTGDFCTLGYLVHCYLEMQRGNIENVYWNFFF